MIWVYKTPGLSLLLCLLVAVLVACTEQNKAFVDHQEKRAVYVLVDASGHYSSTFNDVQKVMRYLLRTLQPGESLALARIDSGSFNESDIVARMTFDIRPSMANAQKRAFLQMLENFSKDTRSSKQTDITGGTLQAIEYLNEAGSRSKHILLFSDLKEETREDKVRDFPVNYSGASVVAMYGSNLQSKNLLSKDYVKRMEYWENKVEKGMGSWKQITDLDQLDTIFE